MTSMVYALVFVWYGAVSNTVVSVDMFTTKAQCEAAKSLAVIDPEMGKVVCVPKVLKR